MTRAEKSMEFQGYLGKFMDFILNSWREKLHFAGINLLPSSLLMD